MKNSTPSSFQSGFQLGSGDFRHPLSPSEDVVRRGLFLTPLQPNARPYAEAAASKTAAASQDVAFSSQASVSDLNLTEYINQRVEDELDQNSAVDDNLIEEFSTQTQHPVSTPRHRPIAVPNPRLTVPNVTPGGSLDGTKSHLRPVTELPDEFRSVFSGFPYFNVIQVLLSIFSVSNFSSFKSLIALQSDIFDDVMYGDRPLVVSAPTGSGKTVIFELAMVRVLQLCANVPEIWNRPKMVYMAPMKSLCSEKFREWKEKFEDRKLGVKVRPGCHDMIKRTNRTFCDPYLST
jgi:ATP-dependent helicase YprA (DUF1998 family)